MPKIPLSEELQKQYDPIEYLIYRAQKTEIPFVYKNRELNFDPNLPLIIIVFGPGGAGKDTITEPLYDDGAVYKVQTATSRPRRVSEGESEDYYMWMRQRKDNETEEEYINTLVKEYKLLEHINYNGSIYGVPLDNLHKTMEYGTPMLVITTAGVESVTQEMKGKANVVTVFVVPESYEQLYKRILNRENPEHRIQISLEEVKKAPELADFYLYNPVEFNGKPGLPQVQNALSTLVEKLHAKLEQ